MAPSSAFAFATTAACRSSTSRSVSVRASPGADGRSRIAVHDVKRERPVPRWQRGTAEDVEDLRPTRRAPPPLRGSPAPRPRRALLRARRARCRASLRGAAARAHSERLRAVSRASVDQIDLDRHDPRHLEIPGLEDVGVQRPELSDALPVDEHVAGAPRMKVTRAARPLPGFARRQRAPRPAPPPRSPRLWRRRHRTFPACEVPAPRARPEPRRRSVARAVDRAGRLPRRRSLPIEKRRTSVSPARQARLHGSRGPGQKSTCASRCDLRRAGSRA